MEKREKAKATRTPKDKNRKTEKREHETKQREHIEKHWKARKT